MKSSSLSDKTYWRFVSESRAHCFTKRGRFYASLCGDLAVKGIGRQSNARPEAVLRCARCDRDEMERRGWSESGPTLAFDNRLRVDTVLPWNGEPRTAIMFRGTYIHATIDGDLTMCGRPVFVAQGYEPVNTKDDLLCSICRKAVLAC